MSAATKDFRPIKRGWLGSVDRAKMLPSDGVPHGTPSAIEEANAAALSAMDALDEATAADHQAQAELKEAPSFDHHREATAIASGEKTPNPTEPAKAKVAQQASRRREAAESVARERIAQLYDAIELNRDDYLAALDAQDRAHEDRASELLGELIELCVERRAAEIVSVKAREWRHHPSAELTHYSPKRTPRDRFERDLAKARGSRQHARGTRMDLLGQAGDADLIAALEARLTRRAE